MSVSAEEILEELVRRIARAVVAEMRAEGATTDEWLDQHHSYLTVRQHCRAVRLRRAEGKPGAAIQGRRYLLSREALREEMTRGSAHKAQTLELVTRLERSKRGAR